jgi:hypothetical protein
MIIPPIPESHLPPGIWLTQAEMIVNSAHNHKIPSHYPLSKIQS